MLMRGEFWVGALVGVGLFYAWTVWQAKKAGQ